MRKPHPADVWSKQSEGQASAAIRGAVPDQSESANAQVAAEAAMTAARTLRAECGMDVPPLRRRTVAARLRRALRNRCEQAFLFGSLARDEHTVHSDIDLCIVADTEAPFAERFVDFVDIVQEFSPIDLVVLTPSEFRAAQDNPDDGFWRDVMSHRFRVI